jgi:hypothetical protein
MMTRLRPHIAIAGFAAFAFFSIPAGISAASQQATVQGLVGTWNCITHTSDHKTYRGTDVDTMYGRWLKIESAYPAQNGEPAGTAQIFFGYDSKHNRWIVGGVDTGGNYFMNYSNSTNFDGSQWHDGFPNQHGSAVVSLTPYTRYTVDSKGPNEQGKMVTSHEVCTKG